MIVTVKFALFCDDITTISSLEGEVLSRNFDPFCYLTVPIPVDKSNISLQDCFDLFTQNETMDDDNKYQHPKTKEYINVKRQCFWNLPKIMIVCLKRFDNFRRKITSR